MGKHAQSSTVQSSIQYGAEGSVLQNLPSRIHPAERLLKEAVWWIDAAHSSASGQSITNLGWGGSALNAQAGSSGSADSNDPKHLPWTGENYVYLPGVSGNYLSVPDEAALDITGDIDIRVKVALDDWTPAGAMGVVTKRNSSTSENSFCLFVNTNGTLAFSWSADGTTLISKNSTVAPTVADGSALWIRATLDVDNGAAGNDVKFWTSADGVAWTQLGTTVTTAGTTNVYSGTASVVIGSTQTSGTTGNLAASVYRAIVKNGIDGPTVLDVDCSQITTGSATSFTARTGQTVSINRSTSGRKAVAVTQPCWLFGTDDYLEVADNDLLDFGASDSFTLMLSMRVWNTPAAYTRYVNKRQATTNNGYAFSANGAAIPNFAEIDDGPNVAYSASTAPTAGLTQVTGFVVDRTAQTINTHLNGSFGSAQSVSAIGSIVSTAALKIGASTFADMEGIAFAVFRKALTQYEIELLNDYYQNRGE